MGMNSVSVLLKSIVGPSSGLVPNAGPSLENAVFDPTLYGLTALIAVVALCAAIFGLRANARFTNPAQKGRAAGTGLVALGFAVIVVTEIAFLVLMRAEIIGGYLYQQAQFSVAYAGSAMILYGVGRAAFAAIAQEGELSSVGPMAKLRQMMWIVFLVSVVVSAAYLFDPLTYTVTSVGGTPQVAQELVFWLPVFVTLAAGAIGMTVSSVRSRTAAVRRHAVWFSLFFFSVIFALLRESTIIPSSGDPLVDLLAAFVPFAVGSICMCMSALNLLFTKSLP
jgi:hypothetical protein